MQISLLQTKFHIPSPLRGFVPRLRLLDQLRKGLDRSLTVMAAPAGFGKTALIGEWIHATNPQVAWVSLDRGDNDPNRFWTYFIAALQMRHAYVGENALEFLRARSTEALPGQAFLDSLINDLATLNEDWALVLDDYHEIDTPAIHEGVVYLLDHLPPLFHLILSTRSTPPFPLARWRVRRRLAEVRADDLRFTVAETAAFLNQAMGLSLTGEDVAVLEERTEGWIAGLQLAALSMQGQQDPHRFIQAFSGSNRYVVDYLSEEVLNRQQANIQSFLLQTSILARMNASLCNAILEIGVKNSQTILEQLERDQLFVIALDPDRQWYRYHYLFAESLRNRLRRMPSDDLAVAAELHRRASDWFEQNGLLDEAIHHALSAADYVRSFRLITQAAPLLFPRAEFKTLFDWVGQLPADQVRANNELMTYLGWMWLLTGQSEKLTKFISTTQTDQSEEASPGNQGRLLGIKAMLALLNEQNRESLAFGREALSLLKPEDHFIRSIVLANFSRAQVYAGEMEGAVQTLQEAVELSERSGSRMVRVNLLVSLAMEIDLMGRRREAITLCQRALALSRDARGQLSFIATTAYVGLSWLAYEANELEEAHESIRQAETFLNLLDLAAVQHSVLQMRFLLQLAHGEREVALGIIQEARQFAERLGVASYLSTWTGLEAEIHLQEGNLAHAVGWADTVDVHRAATNAISSVVIPMRDNTFFTYIRTLLAQRKWEEAHVLLTEIEQSAHKSKRNGPLVSLFLMHAHIKWEQGEPGNAIHFLEQAVRIAAPEGVIRSFLDEAGPQMAALPRVRLVAPAFVDTVLSALGEMPHLRPGLITSVPQQTPLVEPISDREFEVLQLIAEGYTNREIARKLVVEVSTVKKHINNIFGKLGVTHRAQAIARGRELGIL